MSYTPEQVEQACASLIRRRIFVDAALREARRMADFRASFSPLYALMVPVLEAKQQADTSRIRCGCGAVNAVTDVPLTHCRLCGHDLSQPPERMCVECGIRPPYEPEGYCEVCDPPPAREPVGYVDDGKPFLPDDEDG